MADETPCDFGALVGWMSATTGDRLTLTLQSVDSPPPHKRDDVHKQVYFMTRQQAVLLGNYLFEMAGETKPDFKSRSWLARLFG